MSFHWIQAEFNWIPHPPGLILPNCGGQGASSVLIGISFFLSKFGCSCDGLLPGTKKFLNTASPATPYPFQSFERTL